MKADSIEIVEVAIEALIPADYNPRKMSKREAANLQRSLEVFGAVEPAVVNSDGTIVGGHMRVAAARELGWATFPVVYVDLSDQEAKTLNIALNRISGEWDTDALADLIEELKEGGADLALTGFDAPEVSKLLGDGGGIIEDEKEIEVPDDPDTQPGDLFRLGDHYLLCGDSTEPGSYERLFGAAGIEKATMLFTDPPWNVGIGLSSSPKHRQRPGLANDSLSAEDFTAFLDGFIAEMPGRVEGDTYVVLGASEWPRLDWRLREHGYHWSATIIWRKIFEGGDPGWVLGRSKYHRGYEPLWYGWHKDAKSSHQGRRDLEDVWEIPRPRVSKEHPTMKPIALPGRAIENSSSHGDWVLDPFGGAGSTLLAADQLGRRCLTIELDPGFCDVIRKRFEEQRGIEAERLEVSAA